MARAKSLPVPWGMTPSPAPVPAFRRPSATARTVPSPPTANTRSQSAAALRACSTVCPERVHSRLYSLFSTYPKRVQASWSVFQRRCPPCALAIGLIRNLMGMADLDHSAGFRRLLNASPASELTPSCRADAGGRERSDSEWTPAEWDSRRSRPHAPCRRLLHHIALYHAQEHAIRAPASSDVPLVAPDAQSPALGSGRR